MRARDTSRKARGGGRLGVVVTAVALLAGVPVQAEPSAALDLYRAAVTPEGGFVIERPAERKHLAPAAGLYLEHASDPLVFEARRGAGGSERVALVSDQTTLHLSTSLGLFDRALVYATLPVHLSMRGTALGAQPTATGTGFGDLALGGRVGIGASENGATAIQATVTAPTGEGGRDGAPGVAGDEGATFEPEFIGELGLGGLYIVTNFGLRWRKNVTLAGIELRDALTYSVGVVAPLKRESLDLNVELHGTTPVEDVGDRGASPAEAIAGLRLHVEGGWSAGLGGGVGLSRGYGTPDTRVIATVGWVGQSLVITGVEPAPGKSPSEPAPALEPSRASAPVVDPATIDADGDGIRNPEDRCPDLPGEPGNTGCPESFDERERPEASRGPEPSSEPEPSPEAAPAPTAPRTTAALAAAIAASPGADDDGDGVWNAKDKCPLSPGQPARKGCPQGHRLDLEAGRFELLERIRFEPGKPNLEPGTNLEPGKPNLEPGKPDLEPAKPDLDPRSEPWLDEIAATLRASPAMKVRVEAHGPGDGDPAASLALTRSRAAAVRGRLVASGAAAAQIEAYGCGEVRPIAPTRVPWGRKKNERIEIVLLDPTPVSGVASAAGCARAE